MYNSQKKHKAQHGGYRHKPSRKDVNALMNLYAGVAKVAPKVTPAKKEPGVQLKMEF